MAHKTLIGGTAYEISGGKTLIGGTAYEIKKGKTLVGGTAYEVSFFSGTVVTITPDPAYASSGNVSKYGSYIQIHGIQYKDSVSGIVVQPGDIIVFYANTGMGMGGSGKLYINGALVASCAARSTFTHEWAVPDGISKIYIETYWTANAGTVVMEVTAS